MRAPILLISLLVAIGVGTSVGRSSIATGHVAQSYPIVDGALVGDGGKPLVGRVWLFLTLPSLRPGEKAAQLPILGSAATQLGTGRFVISAFKPAFAASGPPNVIVQNALDGIKRNGGWANLDLIATDGKVLVYKSLARHIAPGASPSFASSYGGFGVGDVTMAPGAPGVVLIKPRKTAEAQKAAPAGGPTWGPRCVETVRAVAEAKRPTVVGEIHAAGDSHETFTYGQQAYSDIGVGLVAGTGSFSVSGETHVGNSSVSSEGWSSDTDNNKKLLAYFTYKRFEHRTLGPCPHVVFTTVAATEWDFGEALAPAKDLSNQCRNPKFLKWRDRYPRGTGHYVTRKSGKAHTYKDAVTVFGLTLAATSGYSTGVWLHWTAGTAHKWYYLCAYGADPRVAPRFFTGFSG